MTKSSPSRLARRHEPITFGDIMPKSTVFPEDIPVLFRKTAEEIAGAYFEEEVGPGMFNEDNTRRRSKLFRARWRVATSTYVKLNWPSFLETAKTILVGMLRNPGITEAQKEEIAAAFFAQAADPKLNDLSEQQQAVN
jgi:hypothetical protein